MADSNNRLVADMPGEPNPKLRRLDHLVGTWKVTGPQIEGQVSFEWMGLAVARG